MTLTRKDFFILAREIRQINKRIDELNLKEFETRQIKSIVQEHIIGFCHSQNSLFNSNRFLSEVNNDTI